MRRYVVTAALLLLLGAAAAFGVASAQANPKPPPPPGQLSFNPTSLDFGTVTVGRRGFPSDLTLTYSYTGKTAAKVALSLSPSTGPFAISGNTCPKGGLKPNKSCTITVTYTPTTVGSNSATLTASATGLASVSVSLTGQGKANTTPTANSGSVATAAATKVTIDLSGTDPDGDPLDFAIASNPSHGTLSAINTGLGLCLGTVGVPLTCHATVDYTPNAGYSGTDSFTFTVNDGLVSSDPGTVSITIGGNTAPTATSTSDTLYADSPYPIGLSGTDPESDPLTFAIASNPSHGTLSAIRNVQCPPESGECLALVVYTPASGYTGGDSFTYTVNDGALTSAPAMVSLTITASGVSATPMSLDFGAKQIQVGPIVKWRKTITFTNTSSSTVHLVDSAINAENAFSEDAFLIYGSSLTVCKDGLDPGQTCIADIGFTPTAVGAYNSFFETHWADAENTEVAALNAPLSGTGIVNIDQSPSELIFDQVPVSTTSATQQVTFTNKTTTTLNMNGMSTATGFGSNYSTSSCHTTWLAPEASCTLSVTFSPTAAGVYHGYLVSAWQAPGSDAAFAYVMTAVHGTTPGLTLSITSTPTALNFGNVPVGTTSDPQVVTFTNDTTQPLQTPAYGSPPFVQVVSGCTDLVLWPGETCTVSVTFSPMDAIGYSGQLSVNWAAPHGATTIYTTHTQLTGTGTFDQRPTANAQSVTTAQDAGTAITLSATDPDNDALTYTVRSLPSSGDLYAGSGTSGHQIVGTELPYKLSGSDVYYMPTPGSYGSDSFDFTASDGTLDSAPATISITVNQANQEPMAYAQSNLSVSHTSSLPITLTGSDPEGADLTFGIVDGSGPAHGTLSEIGTPSCAEGYCTADVTYTPDGSTIGSDEFTFAVNDGEVSDTATISIDITNTAPYANSVPDVVSVDMNSTENPIILGGGDEDGDEITFYIVGPSHGTLDTLSGDTYPSCGGTPSLPSPLGGIGPMVGVGACDVTVLYTPDPDYQSSDSFTFYTSDGWADSVDTQTVSITVAPPAPPE